MMKYFKILRTLLLIATLAFLFVFTGSRLGLHFAAAQKGMEFEVAVVPDKKLVVDGAYLNFEMPCVVKGNFDKRGRGFLPLRKDKQGFAAYDPVVPEPDCKEPGLLVRSRLALWDQEIEPPFSRWYLGKVLSKDEAQKLTSAVAKGKMTIKFRVLHGMGNLTGLYLDGKLLK